MRAFFTTSLLFFMFCAAAQKDLPTQDFKHPLDIPLVLAGTFGELRSNHFHSGLDIKTQFRTGLPVVAAAQGYVSRIKVEHYGYGKALYLEHPNGYTTVYAHLEKFSPKIEAYVNAKQYENESYEIELFPDSEALMVEQGEQIALSGNTGGSAGPHLHFEIRDEHQRPMNPKLFDINIKDTQAPLLRDLYVYPLSNTSQINQSQERQKLRFSKQKDGSYLSEKIEAYGAIGFAVGTVDMQDEANNKNGIYKIETIFNGDLNLSVIMDKFSFAETRFLNRMIDYQLYEENKTRVQKLFVEKNNPLSIFKNVKDKGYLHLTEEGATYVYTINIFDFKGNRTSLLVPIKVNDAPILKPYKKEETSYFAQSDNALEDALGKWQFYIPKNALYEDTYLDIKVEDGDLKFHKDVVPLHKYVSLRYDISNYSQEDREKLYIAAKGYGDNAYYRGATLDGDWLVARVRNFDHYTVKEDRSSPTIKAVDVKDGKWMSKYEYLDFIINDEESGIKNYRATINGEFILMEYEYKKDRLRYYFDKKELPDTENNLKLIVTDNVGNSSTFTTTFYRK